MTLIAVIMGLLVGLVLGVTFLVRLLTHHTVFHGTTYAPQAPSRHAPYRNDPAQPRRAGR